MADSNIINGVTFITGLTLNEVLVKTSYFVQANKPGDKEFQDKPAAYGTGFMVLYKGRTFFVTADHVAHVKDHNLKKRTGENNVVGVHTYTRKDLSAQVILLSESFYAENYNIKSGNALYMGVSNDSAEKWTFTHKTKGSIKTADLPFLELTNNSFLYENRFFYSNQIKQPALAW